MVRMPFHCAAKNMAALLRSARLSKFSPSGLLQITGVKRNGPPLSRLYSGSFGGSRSAGCLRQLCPSTENTLRQAWPYGLGCVRNYALATVKNNETSVAMQSKQAQQFDWALSKVDTSVRKTGRITKTLLLRIFHDTCRTNYPSGNQALLLLRGCGTLLAEVPMEERTELAHHIWEKLWNLGVQYDVSHYNALLKVYLQNEFKFSPTDFLAKMEAANIQPNRVTYQRLIAAYCQTGDIEGASTILGFMKSKDLPITEAVFNSLVTGHARAGDLESARNMLTVMKGAGIDPGPDTYISLLNVYAEKGDMDSFKKTLEAAESADCTLMDRDFMQIILTLAKAGHQQHLPEMVDRLRHERGYVPDAMNLCLSLITQGHEDTAFYILKTFPTLQSDHLNSESFTIGNFFLRHCVARDTPLEKLSVYCKELQEANFHSSPLIFTLSCALEFKKTVLSLQLMKMLKEQGSPIRPHYFWPLLTQHLKDKNTDGVLEVLKGMQDLGVVADVNTYHHYVLPVFSSTDAAGQALKNAGFSWESEGFAASEIRTMAITNLAELYDRLSDPSFPAVPLTTFRTNLRQGFIKSNDVESMAKITALLHKDTRFSKHPADMTSYFLYNLISSSSAKEVLAQEEKLKAYFTQLKAQNITIPGNIYKGIRNLLESYHIPELIKYVSALVDPKQQDLNGLTMGGVATGEEGKVSKLEKKMEELISENKPISLVLKRLINALCAEENLEQALQLKEKHEEDMTVGGYVALMSLCCRHNNVDEALNLKREISRKDSSVSLEPSKYITLVQALSQNGRIEEAVDILKEMKEKEVVLDDSHVTMMFHVLNWLAAKGDSEAVKKLQDTIFTLGLTKPSANLCSPLITSYLASKDISGALEAAMECQNRYKCLPRIHDIIIGLVEKGDNELLQKAMDFVSQSRGEMTMLYDLFFAFLQMGHYREARKIIETPGLRARPGCMQWYAEKCISTNQMEPLEQMVDMTAKLFECDRDEMYWYILRLCKATNDSQKAEAVWTKMQEESIIPRERTLKLVADILKSNGEKVPFDLPETWYAQTHTQEPKSSEAKGPVHQHLYDVRIMSLCKKKEPQEAYQLLKDATENGLEVRLASYDHVIQSLLSKGYIEDAMAVKKLAQSKMPTFTLSDMATSLLIITQCKKGQTEDALQSFKAMMAEEHLPTRLAITRLVQALGSSGNVEGIQSVESLIKGLGTAFKLSSMLFVNNTALARIKNGNVDSAVELLEDIYAAPGNSDLNMSFVFRKVLEEGNGEAVDKLSAMAERLANHFACYQPASNLFLQLLEVDRLEDAKFMLARCNAVAEQRKVLLSYVTEKARVPGQVVRIKTLHSLIPDFVEKEVLCSYLMKCHFVDKDLSSAKALYEQMQQEGVVVDELSLKRLAVLYRNHGEVAPFCEPPESFMFYAKKLEEERTDK